MSITDRAPQDAPIVYATTRDDLVVAYRVLRDSTHIALDLETTGTDPLQDRILLYQFCGKDGVCYVVPARDTSPLALKAILDLLPERVTIAHHAAFEYSFVLTHHGIRLGKVYDSMLAERILTAGLEDLSAGLGPTIERRLGISIDKGLQTSFVGADPETFSPTQDQIEYAAHDVAVLHDLRRVQMDLLKKEGLGRTAALEFEVMPIFARMQLAGMRLDLDEHAAVLARYQEEAQTANAEALETLTPYWTQAEEAQQSEALIEYEHAVEELAPLGKKTKDTPLELQEQITALRKARDKAKKKLEARPLSLTSRAQVLAALHEAGIDLTNLQAETVAEHAHLSPVLGSYARWAKAQKVVSTYGDNLREKANSPDGRIHSDYNQIVSTGRTSSRDPNMQNMPKDIRACFKPAPGKVFVVADFANVELRVAAALSQDPVMLDAFNSGKDLHKMTAAAAWPERYADWTEVDKESDDRAVGKTSNFAAIYGSSARGLVTRGVLPDLATAETVIGGISTLYRGMWRWINQVGEQALRTGCAQTAIGRKRYFRNLGPCPEDPAEEENWRRERGGIRRAAMNMPVQGGAADCAKRAMIILDAQLPDGDAIVGMVHDELITECWEKDAEAVEALTLESMKQAGAEMFEGLDIIAEAHVVDRWVK